MRLVLIRLTLVLALLTNILYGGTVKLRQEKGIWQDKPEKQLKFEKWHKVNFDFDNAPLKEIKKIAIYQNKLFILDGKRWQLYVMDKTGKYLYTIGMPGQGPGDLEYAVDFAISDEGFVYILNSIPRRIEVFNINGKPLKTIKLESPSVWSFPHSVLVDHRSNIILAYPLNDLVVINNSKGFYQKTLLKRKKPLIETTENIGIPSTLHFINNRGKQIQEIVHYDRFNGVFTITDKTGNVRATFGAYIDEFEKKIRQLEEEISEGPKKNFSSVLNILLWTNFCMDETGNIYTMPILVKNQEYKELYVFSYNGTFLYKKPTAYLKQGTLVMNMCCDKECFVFSTKNLDLIIGTRR
jgi:hypothetical protein